ncbi:hypothetical protein Tco_1414110, partial [Tanacetum coccineum]
EDDDMNENVNNEDIEDEDVEMEVDDDAELIFPYEVEGDQTLPPRDESSDSEPPNVYSSDSVSSDSESEDEEIDVAPEVDVAPEATVRTSTQKPYAIRDFPRGLYEVGESSSARDSSYVGGLAPWALRRDLETSRARARLTEAELDGDYRLAELYGVILLRGGCMSPECGIRCSTWIWIIPPKAMSEARMREVIREQVAASMAEFMANMNCRASGDGAGSSRADGDEAGGGGADGGGAGGAGASGAGAGGAEVGGAGPAAPKITGCTYITFMKCEPQPFKGIKGAMGLCRALTWWNGRIASMGIDAANDTPWTELKGTDIDGYINRFHELALLFPRMVEPEQVKVEQYIHGLSKNIRGDVTSSRPTSIDETVRMAYQLMGQIIQDKTDEVSESEKRKGEGDCGGRGDNRRDYNRRQNQRRANAGAMTNVAPNDNEVCPKCKNKKHAGDCWKCGSPKERLP